MLGTPSAGGTMSLLDFTRAISQHINSNPGLREQWVVAELSDFRMHGPHAYGQLIEKDAAGKTIARIQGTIWANALFQIRRKFFATTNRDIADGMKLMLKLTASHSPAYGLSANITDVDPSYTLGDIERLRREILDTLRREGIYDANRSEPLSPAPQKIAVISAAGAAGYGDFTNQLQASGFTFYPLLFQANMQGERTVPSILNALERIEMSVDFWDCVVIIRGGGATADLNWFDNLELARRVATYPIPIIVGIGHERDNTVLDYVANTRCKTPTAVAAFLIDRLTEAEARAEELTRLVTERTRNVLAAEQQRLAHMAAMLPVLAPSRLQYESNRLERAHSLITRLATAGVNRAKMRLSDLASRLARTAGTTISRHDARLANIPDTLRSLAGQRIRLASNSLDSAEKMIAVLSPEATLRRGYSITRIEGKAIRSAAEATPGTVIETTLPDGTICSRAL
ncbi:MAG: exodeoxyribonuclease VII large subunit [Muribaculaceae bacterium]|nr:exodeoxyribonuclease VII large subunit [Muribaculaceae bacterium]